LPDEGLGTDRQRSAAGHLPARGNDAQDLAVAAGREALEDDAVGKIDADLDLAFRLLADMVDLAHHDPDRIVCRRAAIEPAGRDYPSLDEAIPADRDVDRQFSAPDERRGCGEIDVLGLRNRQIGADA